MRAIRFRRTGGPGVLSLEEVPDPVCARGHLVVATRAVGVNYADVHFRRGEYFEKPAFPEIPGLECAGQVLEVGEGVSRFGVGDRVLVYSRRGAYAEKIATPAELVYPIPATVSFEDAAAVGVQGLTAMHLLGLAGQLAPGQSVLVHASAGGVGSLLVQLAKRRGGLVVATAGSDAKRGLARELGADWVLDSRTADFARGVLAAVPGGVDLALEMVGGSRAYEENLSCLAPFGRMIVYGAVSGDVAGTVRATRLMSKNLSVAGYFLTHALRDRSRCEGPLSELLELVAGKTIRVVRGATLPLAEAARAHAALEARESVGKIVLMP